MSDARYWFMLGIAAALALVQGNYEYYARLNRENLEADNAGK